MNKMNNSIVKKMGFAIFIFALLLFTIYYNFLNVQIKTYLEDVGKEHLRNESRYLSAEIEMFLQKYTMIVDQAGKNASFINIASNIKNRNTKRNNPLYDSVLKELSDLCSQDENIEQVYLALDGVNDLITNVNNYDIGLDYDLSTRDWYTNTISQDKTTITLPYIDLISNKLAITIATPLKKDGEVVGAFGLDILLEDLYTVMRQYETAIDSDLCLIYDNGLILYTSNANNTLGSEFVYLQESINENIAAKVLSGESGFTQYNQQGEEKYIAYVPVKDTNIIVFANILRAKILEPINRFIWINLFILLIIILIIICFLFFIERLISAPLIKICKEIENYTKDISINLPTEFLKRKDEVGTLSNGITFMLNKISNYILKLEEKNEELFYTKEMINRDRILFKTTLRSLGDGVISTDINGDIQIMNDVAEKLTGWKKHEAFGRSFEEVFVIINEFSRETVTSPVKKVFESKGIHEIDENTLLVTKHGKLIPIEDSAAPILDKDGNITGVVIVFRDFTDKKQKQEKITYLSYHDQLTGLYNRHFFQQMLKDLDTLENLPLSVVMLDVNGLKLTNDAFGHQMGDRLLQTITDAIKKFSREQDVASRIGGDEFVLLLPRTTNKETGDLIKQIEQEFTKTSLENIEVSVSIGWETKTLMDEKIMGILAKAEENMYRKKLCESQSMRCKTIKNIIESINTKSPQEKAHGEHVSRICETMAEAMQIDEDMIQEIKMAALLHDIGKIAISNTLLEKPDKLTITEFEMVKRHAEIGYHILKSVDTYSVLADFVLAHHENWDGTGYPRGLKGEEIPLVSRMISIADSYDQMITDRPFRKALSIDDAKAELVRCAGTKFDPSLVNVFLTF
ncbi:HD domain-containing phosphohydrolase [Anaerotignum sp.]|uniref:HD domain-containing phosphohydrolase n=1 Tax=Anaerotignum sp. TaxID=2039241 RepID=UPI0033319B3F